MKYLFLFFVIFLSSSIAQAKILKSKEEVKNCQVNFDKMADKDKIDCLQTIVQMNIISQGRQIADLELLTENLSR